MKLESPGLQVIDNKKAPKGENIHYIFVTVFFLKI